jgi:ABC-2 type transport system permease protein
MADNTLKTDTPVSEHKFPLILKNLNLYLSFMKITIRSQMAHRSAFWAGLVGQWLAYGSSFATLYILVSNFRFLADFSAQEVLFLYAMNLLSYALGASFFFNPCINLASKIRTGEFDAALTKPVSPFGHEFYMGFNFGYLSHITLSAGVMIYALVSTGFTPSLLSILVFTGVLTGAVLVQSAFLITASAFSFFLINENPVFELVWNIKVFTNYPLRIYPLFLQIFLTFIVPVAFMNFYPASAVLGKEMPFSFPVHLGYLSPLAGIILFVLSVLFWNRALSKYQSTGT